MAVPCLAQVLQWACALLSAHSVALTQMPSAHEVPPAAAATFQVPPAALCSAHTAWPSRRCHQLMRCPLLVAPEMCVFS